MTDTTRAALRETVADGIALLALAPLAQALASGPRIGDAEPAPRIKPRKRLALDRLSTGHAPEQIGPVIACEGDRSYWFECPGRGVFCRFKTNDARFFHCWEGDCSDAMRSVKRWCEVGAPTK